MATKRVENSQFVYLTYDRKIASDFEQFKKELLNCATIIADKDIVVDLSGFVAISSPEVGALIRIAQSFKGSIRFLRIVPSPTIQQTLSHLNLHSVENLSIYESRDAFLTELKKLAPDKS